MKQTTKHDAFWSWVADMKARIIVGQLQCPACLRRAYHKPDCPALKGGEQ